MASNKQEELIIGQLKKAFLGKVCVWAKHTRRRKRKA